MVIASLVREELARVRPRGTAPPNVTWDGSLAFARGGLECDSLELVALGSRVNQMFHLHESGGERALLTAPTLADWADVVESAIPSSERRLTFLTMGPAGIPTPCEHRHADLLRDAAAIAERHADRKRIVTFTPPNRLFGYVSSVLVPALLGVEVLDALHLPADALGNELRPGDLLIAAPWTVTRPLAKPLRLDPAVHIALSGSHCEPLLWDRLRNAGASSVWEYYAATQSGVVACRPRPDHAMRLHSNWSRDERGRLHRLSSDAISVPIDPMDRLEWFSQTEFEVRGRADESIKIAGENVFPTRVLETLRRVPGVREASLRIVDSLGDRRLEARVAIDPDELSPQDARSLIDQQMDLSLHHHERPSTISIELAAGDTDAPRHLVGSASP